MAPARQPAILPGRGTGVRVTDEIEELRKRIDRLEWLIGAMRDKETVDALKGSLIDAQRRLEDMLKKRNGGIESASLYFRVQALRIVSLAGKSGDRRVAAELRVIAAALAAQAAKLAPVRRRKTG
jgi:hypothetical protein